ncbi:MAG: DNA repair protein RecO [Chromatocurvus sp.]
MRITLQPAYLLHRRPFRDSSQLLEVLTAEHGRLGLVARGVRRKSRGGSSGSLLQPFAPLLLSFSGSGELKTLTGIEAGGGIAPLRGDALLSGFYLNELAVRLLHRDDPQPAIFAAYAVALAALADGGAIEEALRAFEFSLLEALGYRVELAVDAAGGCDITDQGCYSYRPGVGLVPQGPSGVAEVSAGVYAGADLLAVARGDYRGSAGQAAKRLARAALAELLGGRPLRSRELFLQHRQRARDS